MAKFRVVAGYHNEGGETYGPGDIVDSASDLNKHNKQEAIKFEQVGEVLSSQDELKQHTVAELQDLAAEEEIDLGDATKKAEIVEVILIARGE